MQGCAAFSTDCLRLQVGAQQLAGSPKTPACLPFSCGVEGLALITAIVRGQMIVSTYSLGVGGNNVDKK